jgi:Tfp pilus assembly protein PilN
MTTTVLPPESSASAARALRIPAISANLIPGEIVEARRVRKIKRVVLSALAGVVVLLAAWYGVSYYQTSMARGDLSRAEQRAEALRREQKAFDELVRTQAESQAIRAQLSVLLANDLQWAGLVTAVRAAAPAGVEIIGLTCSVAQTGGQPARNAGGELPNRGAEPVIGTVTVTGLASSKPSVAAYVDALGTVAGLANPLLNSATQEGSRVRFTVDLNITRAALGGRFTPKAGK